MRHPKYYFDKEFCGAKNIMTPYVIMYGYIHKKDKDMVYELSKGTGISGDPIYAVTVLGIGKDETITNEYDLSLVGFHHRSEVDEYIQEISEEEEGE